MTMRSTWKGTISTGGISVPVALVKAVSDESRLPLHRVRRADGSRVRQLNVAEADRQLVTTEDITSGYEMPNGQVVLVEDDDMAATFGTENSGAAITAFIPVASMPPRTAAQSSYYVRPEKGSERAYGLLAHAMLNTGRAAVLDIALRQRKSLAVLYPTAEGYLVLERVDWAANVRAPDFAVPKLADLAAEQVELMENLIALSPGSFDYASVTDTSAQKLEEVVQRKAEAGLVLGKAKVPGDSAPADLTEVLKASVAAAREASRPAPAKPARRSRAKAPAA